MTGGNNAEHRRATFCVEHISDHGVEEGNDHVRVAKTLETISRKDEDDDPYFMMVVVVRIATESEESM